MRRRLYIPDPHPFEQRKHWTGVCVRPGCGLPTEHDVHQHALAIEIQDEPLPVFELQMQDIEPEQPKPLYIPQLSLF